LKKRRFVLLTPSAGKGKKIRKKNKRKRSKGVNSEPSQVSHGRKKGTGGVVFRPGQNSGREKKGKGGGSLPFPNPTVRYTFKKSRKKEIQLHPGGH